MPKTSPDFHDNSRKVQFVHLPAMGECWFSSEGGVGYMRERSWLLGPPVSGTVQLARLEPLMGGLVSSTIRGPPGGVGAEN